jgi:hypothetical protein
MPKVQLKTAWIVLDGGKLTDILTARMTFDEVVEYAKELYRANRMSFTEKALLAHYNSGSTVRAAAFEGLPTKTHFTSVLYGKLKESEENLREIGGSKHQPLSKRLAEGPKYVVVGTEPTIEVRKALNLEVDAGENGSETVAWGERSTEGHYVKRHEVTRATGA